MKNKPFIIHPSPASRQDASALEQRRFKAVKLFEKGRSQADVARTLDVTKPAVHYWYTTWKKKGKDGLRAQRPGPKPRLTHDKITAVQRILLKGAYAAGYDTDLWTLRRISDTLRSSMRVRYGVTQVWYLLKALGWSNQKPEPRSKDRNETAIKRWKETKWPAIQKKG